MSSKEKTDHHTMPWYDAWWLNSYELARSRIRRLAPEKLIEFERRFDVLRTREDFEARSLGTMFEGKKLEEMREIVRSLKRDELEFHELEKFGRLLVHDHPKFAPIHNSFTEMMCRLSGEPLEPSYTFLCMYLHMGACPLHMDDPSAKWTLSICLNSSVDWPLYVGGTTHWPEGQEFAKPGWEKRVMLENKFRAFPMEPGKGMIFSGSSQWHFRSPLPNPQHGDSCDLILFHYRPAGQARLLHPDSWPEEFGIPDLFRKRPGQR